MVTDPTPEPVTLDEQIAAVHDEVAKWDEFGNAHPKMTPGERDLASIERETWSAVVATLQQHKRAMAVVEAARIVFAGLNARIDAAAGTGLTPVFDGIADLHNALAAFDTAEPSEKQG